MVRCRLHLFFSPGWELGEGEAVGADEVRALGDALAERCRRSADAQAALAARGWSFRVGRYELVASKPCGRATAMADFLRAGLDPVALSLEEVDESPTAAG